MSEDRLTNRRILVVEDEYMLADDLRRALEAAGAIVLGPVTRVGKALTLIADKAEIDAAVLDINLGGEMVYPLADTLIARGVPILLTTGYSDRDIPQNYANIARCDKPAEPHTVAKALALVIPVSRHPEAPSKRSKGSMVAQPPF